MNIIQDFIPVGRPNRPGLAMTPLYITIHDTDNADPGAGAKAHANFIRSTETSTSWHFTVDDENIIQHLPVTENAWHAGDGRNGTGNRTSIGIEICMNPETDRAVAEQNAAWLVAKLYRDVKTLKPFPEGVVQHYHWTAKNCPSLIRSRPNGWVDFLALVKREIEGGRRLAKIAFIRDGGEVAYMEGFIEGDKVYAPLRQTVEYMGGAVSWDGAGNMATVRAEPWVVEITDQGKKIPGLVSLGRGYVALRELASVLGYKTVFDSVKKVITLK